MISYSFNFLLISLLIFSTELFAQFPGLDQHSCGYSCFKYDSISSYYKDNQDSSILIKIIRLNQYELYRNDIMRIEGYLQRKTDKFVETGEWNLYDSLGRLESTRNYINGKPFGLWTEFYDNGNKKNESLFIIVSSDSISETKGYLDSYSSCKQNETLFYRNGNIQAVGMYAVINGKSKIELLNENTQEIEIINYIDFISVKHGKWDYYNIQGELTESINYFFGEKE